MRKKYNGYIFLFIASDHDGRHIHIYYDSREVGVFDRVLGPIRGLDKSMNRGLQEGLNKFIKDLNERGYFN